MFVATTPEVKISAADVLRRRVGLQRGLADTFFVRTGVRLDQS
jgi:hypothetical protein